MWKSQRVLFLTIQFNPSHLFAHSYIWPIDRMLSGAVISGQCGPGNNGNEGGTPYSPHLQDWSLTIRFFCIISRTLVGGILSFCWNAVGIFYSSCRQYSVFFLLIDFGVKFGRDSFSFLESYSFVRVFHKFSEYGRGDGRGMILWNVVRAKQGFFCFIFCCFRVQLHLIFICRVPHQRRNKFTLVKQGYTS